jgi:hypothetical protein
MRRAFAITAVLILLASCQMSCASFKANELSGKTDAQISYYETWLTSAQLALPLFGSYAPAAQVAISSAYTALELYRRASDWYAAGKIDASQLTTSIMAVQNQIIEINALGNQAGIKQ